jgi:hypothetical protein
MEEDDPIIVLKEATELLTVFKNVKMSLLNQRENLQVILARNNTEIREIDKDISETEILIKKLEEQTGKI